MKTIIIAITVALFSILQEDVSDNFHITYMEGRNSYNVEYAAYKLFGTSNNLVSFGNSDKFGRIALNVSRGRYRLEVTYRKKTYSKQIAVDGNAGMKEIVLN